MVLFWSGEFSQWFYHDMIIDGVKYNTCEQYMMASKAALFEDEETLALIMEAVTPIKQKELGRKVKNFDATKWNAVCRDVVYQANLAKFSHPVMRAYLEKFGDDEIVEASPVDRIWGIGLHFNDEAALDKSKWRGTNWLGEAIMRARTTLRSQDEQA
jgi:hypothetical protein